MALMSQEMNGNLYQQIIYPMTKIVPYVTASLHFLTTYFVHVANVKKNYESYMILNAIQIDHVKFLVKNIDQIH